MVRVKPVSNGPVLSGGEMQSLTLICVVLIGLYLTWKLTRALLSVLFCLILIVLGAYFVLPLVLDPNSTETLDQMTIEGRAVLDHKLEQAKSFAEDEIVKPLKSKLKPIYNADQDLKKLRQKNQRGLEDRSPKRNHP